MPPAGDAAAERPRPYPARVVAFAASTGGPAALQTVLSGLPRPFPVPILVVQHLPRGFSGPFAEQIAQTCALPALELRPGLELTAGVVIVASGGRHMRIERDGRRARAYPDDGPPENSCRPSADVLLRSAAQVFGPEALAVVLTGVGTDGLAGCLAVREAGGRVVAQDEPSSTAWGMPGAVARAGAAQAVLPLGDLAAEIARSCCQPAPRRGQGPWR